MSLEDLPLPSPPPDSSLRGHMSGLFARALADKITSNVFSDPPDSEGDSAGRKRVGFHPWTTNILEPQLSTPDSEIPPSLKSLPPSRDCQLTVRPILKPSLSSQSVLGLDGQNEKISALANMDSLLRNLAVNERSSSVDAYQTMSGLIRTYDEAPEQEVLQRKMTQLQKHIKRDLVVLDIQVDTLPSEDRLSMGNLIMSALKVLVTVVWSPVYSPCLTDEFRAWIIDRAIRVLKEHSAPKAVLLHYMHLIATQNFRPSIMTQQRAQKILEVLQELGDQISGKAVLSERLLVYQKLIQQCKPIMKTRPEMWIKHVFTAMGHSFKEVRGSALSAGTEACTAFAGVPGIATTAREALAEMNGDRTLSVSLTNRLERVIAAKDEANQIPQIWTLVLLLCNCGSQRLDTWQQLQDWLRLIQRCFNSSDMTVRVQAFLAWNRLYYIARPHEASEKIVSMLAKPATVQLDKTANAQSSKGTRQAVISSYCMLLYYAFRPSASSVQYTRMWNEFVVKLMTRSFLSKSASNCDLSCRILAALFHSSLSKTRVWNENRAHENAALDPLELPAIDCKWVRSKTPSILSIVRLIIEYSSFGPSGSMSEQAYAPQVWRHLMQALKESMTKEIKPSSDTTCALNSIVDFLNPTSSGIESTTDEFADYSRRLGLLAKITVDELGSAPMLHAIRNSADSVNVVILEVIIHRMLESPDTSSGHHSSINECLELLDIDLRFLTEHASTAVANTKYLILQYAGDVLEDLGKHDSHNLLLEIQTSICHLVEDADDQFPEDQDVDGVATAHRRFCNVVFELYDGIEPSKQKELATLLSAATSSTHEWIRDFGFTRIGDSSSPKRQHPSSVDPESSAIILPQGHTPIVEETVSERTPAASESRSTISKSRKTKGKPRHQDSQIVFVPVESSPPNHTFESQLLTTRQKEVRERQNAEPAVTFGNVQSSPAVTEKKSHDSNGRSARLSTPEIPGTPTLPLPGGNEDEEQPPTPTPKARRSRRNTLQPEITSSPPSVSGDVNDNSGINITSSPVKEATEAEDALSFEEIDSVLAPNKNEQATTSADIAEVHNPTFDHQGLGVHMPNNVSVKDHTAPSGSTNEDYETAEHDQSSPTIYSDEFDALAASQLSQNLEETSFMTTNVDNEGTDEQPRKTRKRRGGQQEDNSAKKRRISCAKVDEVSTAEAKRETSMCDDEEAEDTIYVSVEKTTPAFLRVTRARAAQETTDQSHVSQQSSASSTPATKKAKGTRRRGRPRKVRRSQASQDGSIPSEGDTNTTSPDDAGNADTDMLEVQPLTDSPSLGSEVEETAESKVEIKIAPEEITTEDINEDAEPSQPTHLEHERRDAEKSIDTTSAENAPDQPTADSINIVANLQNILDNLNNGSTVDNKTLAADLATIHSLCFRIGLKAQELATQ